MLSTYLKNSLLIIVFLFGTVSISFVQGQCGDYYIISFNESWCQNAPYPTAYKMVSFAIIEQKTKRFDQNQNNETLTVTLPAGFEFNQASLSATVANSTGGDISNASFVYNSATQITLTLTTTGKAFIDSILFDDFEIRAMAVGISGNVYRTGGTFQIDGSVDCPGDGNPELAESLGFLIADIPMVYDSSRVNQTNFNPIRKTCGNNSEMLEIKISVSNNCPSAVTQFTFSTFGDIGFSQNPLTNINNASVYYAGTSQGFSPGYLFGVAANPNGVFTINGTQILTSAGSHYFYLTYDVSTTSITGNGLDARLNSFVFDGATITNMQNPNPNGIRLINDSICFQPDLPNPAANLQTIPSGSYIIPMDTVNQSITPPFNLKAYGLIHNLLLNDVPVKWVIRSGKARNDTDFTALTERMFPTILPSALREFRAGAFVIDAAWVNTPYSQWVQSATQVINAFGNNVAIFKLNQNKIMDVRYELNQRPKIAVFNNGGNQAIHIAILDSAGLTPIDTSNPLSGGSYAVVGAGLFSGIDECYTFCSEPHWAGTQADSLTTDNIRDFVDRGGNFLAQCRGVDTYENFSLINIVSTAGIGIVNQTVNHQYSNPDLAYMQFDGDLFENQGGSERNWIRGPGSAWRSGFYYCISDSTRLDTIITSGAHIIAPDSVGGNVFYLGGHDYSPFDAVPVINAARLYLNATLIPSGRPTLFTLDPGDTLFSCVGYPVTLGGSPTGPPDANYLWSPGNWLNDSTAQNPIATPQDSITYSVLAYRGGCIVGPFPIVINVSPVPIPDAGLDLGVCGVLAPISLSGSVTDALGGLWTSLGSGTFANDTALGTTYTPSSIDSAAGFVDIVLMATGGCDSIQDTMRIVFTPSPSIDAGPDQTVCFSNPNVSLNGTVLIASGGVWSTSGTGVFVDSTSLITIYNSSSGDTVGGSITLTLTSTGNGLCPAVSDDVVISFGPGSFVDAGTNQTVCLSDSLVNLNGSVIGGTTTGQWSSSTGGIFNPGNTSLNTSYVFSPIDIANGGVTLVLTSTGNGLCASITDSIDIIIVPKVDAGNDTIICNNVDSIQLNGSFDYIFGSVWTTNGSGTFTPNDSSLNAYYHINANDVVNGGVYFVLTALDSGICLPGTDTMFLTITPPSTATASSDQTICLDSSGAVISGSFSNAVGVIWTTSGSGSFLPAPDSLNAVYVPSSAGIDTLTLTTTGSCSNTSDIIIITITPSPTVDAGPDTAVCATNLNVLILGSITIASGGIWSTPNGTGFFTPSNTNMNPTYNGTTADTATGTITIVLTTTGNGDCNVHTDTMYLTYTPNSISVDAGPDISACSNTAGVALNGSVFVANGGVWTSSGNGIFSPNADSVNTTYIPSSSDTLSGSITLTLTSTGNGGCTGSSDDLILSFVPSPLVYAGPDTMVCYTADTIFLSGLIANAVGGVWSSGGTGIFSPNDSSLNVGYIPSVGDFLNETVTIYLTTYLSCADVVDSITIDIIPGVLVSTADTIVCNDTDTIPVSGIVTGAAGGIWTSSSGGSFFPDDTSLSTNYIVNSLDSTSGMVVLSLTSTGVLMGCPPVTDVMNITITPPPTVAAGPDQFVCSDQDSIQLNGFTTNAGGGIWSSSGTGTFTPDSLSLNTIYLLSPSDTSNGIVILTLTTTGSCMVLSDSLALSISPPPSADFNALEVCVDSITGFVDATQGNIVSWLWDFGDLNTSSNANPQNLYSSAGTYNVTLIVVAQNGCSDTIVKPVLVHPRPVISYDWADVCNKDTMFFTNMSFSVPPDIITGFSWDFGDGNTSTSVNPYNIYQNNGIYIVTLSATSDAGCTNTWDTIVAVSPIPIADFDANPVFASTEEQIDLTDLSLGSADIPDTIGISDWEWNFYFPGNVVGGLSSIQNPSIFYGDTGLYSIQLIVTNKYGCKDTAYKDVQIGLNPVVASAFTPGGSGAEGNNVLVVHGGPYPTLEFIIYNEWGEVIFESHSQDIGWDGTFDGVPQPIGVYVYTVIATSLDGIVHHFWGDVTLLR